MFLREKAIPQNVRVEKRIRWGKFSGCCASVRTKATAATTSAATASAGSLTAATTWPITPTHWIGDRKV